MTREAKDLYQTFQDAMGNWDCPPFEHLSTREMEAWRQATGNVERLQELIDSARQEVREIEEELGEVEDAKIQAEEELSQAIREITLLKSEVTKLTAQIDAFDAAVPPKSEAKKK